jgi:hypothetical protein
MVSVYPDYTKNICGCKETNNSAFFEYLKLIPRLSFSPLNSFKSFPSTSLRPLYWVCIEFITCLDFSPR